MANSGQKPGRPKADGFRHKKALGQHFLYDEGWLNAIADEALLAPGMKVLEVGSGAGTLTKVLCQRQCQVLSIELDPSLMPTLRQLEAAWPNLSVIQGNAVSMDLDALMETHLGPGEYRLVANLPYQISTAFLNRVFLKSRHLQGLCILLQREVAQKAAAKPGKEGYGLLALMAQWYGFVETGLVIPASAFTPPPSVESALLKGDRRESPWPVQEEALWRLIQGVMTQRRKTISNGLKSLGAFQPCNGLSWIEVAEAAAVSVQKRGEELPLEAFVGIAQAAGYGN